MCAAIDVATRDINGTQAPILKAILNLRSVQRLIIVPSILS
jgi:hypothetical protein